MALVFRASQILTYNGYCWRETPSHTSAKAGGERELRGLAEQMTKRIYQMEKCICAELPRLP